MNTTVTKKKNKIKWASNLCIFTQSTSERVKQVEAQGCTVVQFSCKGIRVALHCHRRRQKSLKRLSKSIENDQEQQMFSHTQK